MAEAAMIFVSKRFQRGAAAVLCLMLAQMAISLSSRQTEPVGQGAVRVAISR